jgi:hypothetical protein
MFKSILHFSKHKQSENRLLVVESAAIQRELKPENLTRPSTENWGRLQQVEMGVVRAVKELLPEAQPWSSGKWRGAVQ